MDRKDLYAQLKKAVDPHVQADKDWFLALVDDEKQRECENAHLAALMRLLRVAYLIPLKRKISSYEQEKKRLSSEGASYAEILALDNKKKACEQEIETYKCFFEEPYFARMDVTDEKEGYNSYYIGKKGDEKLEIVDWRAPLAKRYYQKSRIFFSINEYDYKIILRRAIRAKNGKVEDFKNEYLSVKDYLTREEIAGRDEEILFDPYLRRIIKERKDEAEIKDIIETIQEKQFEIITLPERSEFVVDGCAGSGKTMILLHRLSYLMYNNEELKSRDVLVITPSNSFNDFIDELSGVLELEKVKTTTLSDYFGAVLSSLGIDLSVRVNPAIQETEAYLTYLYSPAFLSDVQKSLDKVYDGVYGLLASEECGDIVADILKNCKEQNENYTAVKNASLRVRRAVLGEIKEKAGGGLFYTKPFRDFMNAVLTVEEFLSVTLHGKNVGNQSYFYRRLAEFCQSAKLVVKKGEIVVGGALRDLEELAETLKKEIADYRRYKYYIGGKEFFTYADNIARREEVLKETEKIAGKVRAIGDKCDVFADFYEVLEGSKDFVALGKCATPTDFVRHFYRDMVKKKKTKYGVTGRGLVKSDAYSLCAIFALLGEKMPLRYSLVFVDEGQDISAGEYALLKKINPHACFNVFGDLQQNITRFRGLKDWREAFESDIYRLNQNYRNTNQIVDFVSQTVATDMQAIGFDGPPIVRLRASELPAFFREASGLKAIIAKEERLALYSGKAYNRLGETGKVSKTKINVMSVYESKGLEFSSVFVDDTAMSANEKYIAYTRALLRLAVLI